MANIASVTMGVIPPNRLWTTLTIVFGLLLCLAGLLAAIAGDEAGFAALGIGLIVVGIGIFFMVRAKSKYTVRITSASGETEALISADRDRIERIVVAVQRAIVERG